MSISYVVYQVTPTDPDIEGRVPIATFLLAADACSFVEHRQPELPTSVRLTMEQVTP